jgi:hypothetical protein
VCNVANRFTCTEKRVRRGELVKVGHPAPGCFGTRTSKRRKHQIQYHSRTPYTTSDSHHDGPFPSRCCPRGLAAGTQQCVVHDDASRFSPCLSSPGLGCYRRCGDGFHRHANAVTCRNWRTKEQRQTLKVLSRLTNKHAVDCRM